MMWTRFHAPESVDTETRTHTRARWTGTPNRGTQDRRPETADDYMGPRTNVNDNATPLPKARIQATNNRDLHKGARVRRRGISAPNVAPQCHRPHYGYTVAWPQKLSSNSRSGDYLMIFPDGHASRAAERIEILRSCGQRATVTLEHGASRISASLTTPPQRIQAKPPKCGIQNEEDFPRTRQSHLFGMTMFAGAQSAGIPQTSMEAGRCHEPVLSDR